MTIDEFDKLKVGDCVYIPKSHVTSQAVEINRTKKTIKYLAGNRHYSYRYIQSGMAKKPSESKNFCFMGVASQFSILESISYEGEGKIHTDTIKE